MGGQACILYGAAEFSRDLDLACSIEVSQLPLWNETLNELNAECIAVPPFELDYLERGHAVHFRCNDPNYMGLRIDIMSHMRGVPPFEELWNRRSSWQVDNDLTVDLLSLPDLVLAKKTQRDKDWPMIRRLLEADYLRNRYTASIEQKNFWLRELRTPEFLIELTAQEPELSLEVSKLRNPIITAALSKDNAYVLNALEEEERLERLADRAYWSVLRNELEQLRHSKITKQ
jgi:hypothetical protein